MTPNLDRFASRQRRSVADRRDVGLVVLSGAALEHRGARDKGVGPGGGELARNIRGHTAINLDVDRASRGHRAQVTDLAERGWNKGLTAEPWVHRHHEHEIDQVDDILDRADWGARIQGYAGLLAERPDRLQRAMQARPGFGMHSDVIAAGLRESLEIGIAGRDHQMRVENLAGVRTHGPDDLGPVRNVGHEMPVHDVEVNPVSAGS